MINYLQKVNGKKRHLTSLLADKAIDFLETNPAGQPFCLSISWKAPHGPWNYFDPDLPNPYESADIPLPATYTKAAFESEPMFLRKSLNGSPNGRWYPDAHERFQRVALDQQAGVQHGKPSSGRLLSGRGESFPLTERDRPIGGAAKLGSTGILDATSRSVRQSVVATNDLREYSRMSC